MFVSQEMSLLYNQVVFAASKIEAAMSLQIEAGGKIMGAHKYLGQNLLKSVPRITQGKVSLAFSASLTLPCLHRDSEWLVPSVVWVFILHKKGRCANIKIDTLFWLDAWAFVKNVQNLHLA